MKNVIQRIKESGVKNIKGFITEEIRSQHRNTRIGFDVIDLCNMDSRASLARIGYVLSLLNKKIIIIPWVFV